MDEQILSEFCGSLVKGTKILEKIVLPSPSSQDNAPSTKYIVMLRIPNIATRNQSKHYLV